MLHIPFHYTKFFSVPSIILWDDRLKIIDGYTFAIINMLDNEKTGCYIGNRLLSDMLRRSESTISQSISRLVNTEYVKSIIKTNRINKGRHIKKSRVLRINQEYFIKQRRKMELGRSSNFLSIKKLIDRENLYIRKLSINNNKNLLSKDNNKDKSQETDLSNSTPPSVKILNKKKRTRKKLPTVFRKKEKKVEDKKKQTLFERAPAEDKNVILQWNRLKAGSHHVNKNSGLIRDTLKLLPQLRKKYDYEDMIDAIIYHAQFNSGNKLSILNFFQLNHYQKQYMQNRNESSISPFQKIIDSKEFKEFRKTRSYPKDIYNEIVDYWRKHIAVEDVEFTTKQENHFKLTAVKLKKYMKGKRLERYIDGCKVWDYVNMLFHALDWWWEGGKYTTANFCSDFTFNDTLPRYISEEFEE